MKYVKLCKTNLLRENQMKQCTQEGTEILVVKLGSQIVCFDARCTHAGAPLIYGKIKDGELTCPWHGSRFKIDTGEVLLGPADKPLKIYPHKIEDDYIFVEL